MYYPFFRGKQFELILLKEKAADIAGWGFVPIIEPVRANLGALQRTIEAFVENNCRFILIGNPLVGDLKENASTLWDEIIDGDYLKEYGNFSVGLNLSADHTLDSARIFFRNCSLPTAVIHNGFSDGRALADLINSESPEITEHIFVEQQNKPLYRRHFSNSRRVLIEDSFVVRKNKEYPLSEPFSELYLIFSDELGCDGFGDFLIVGSSYLEGGGPAFAVAIHLTYVDTVADNAIAIKHYVSDRSETQGDPAGKFLEALEKLHRDVTVDESILQSNAVDEFLFLFEEQHFPGLGYVKKLSMQHHLELMAQLLQ